MLITKTVSDDTFKKELEIGKKENSSEDSWITVIVGENGTRKSLLLRNLSEDVLRPVVRRKFASVDGDVSKLIAISGTPLDRFPRLSNRYRSRFAYFGLRAANNVVGTGQSEKSLVSALIFNRNKMKVRASKIESVFGQLGLKGRIKSEFQIGRRFLIYHISSQNNFSQRICEAFLNYCEKSLGNIISVSAGRDYRAGLKFISTDAGRERLVQVVTSLKEISAHVTISIKGNYVTKDTFPIAIWGVLLEAGIIDLKKTSFQPDDDSRSIWGADEIPGSYLSSGQWSWLCTLGGLTAEIENDSAILIDEPENSLHPAWQRDYVPAIINIMKGLTGCHVVVATHSPLIASGLPPNVGNVIRLTRQVKEGALVISAADAPNTFGWSASDAYEELFELETTRAKIFNSDALRALEMIKDSSGSRDERSRISSALRLHCDSLPPLDSMRFAMERVVNSLENLINSEK